MKLSWWSKYQPFYLNESKLGLLMVFSPMENLRSRCHQWNPICYWQAKLFGLTEPNLGFSPNSGWDTSTAPGLSPWCKNRRSWSAMDESCEKGIVSKVSIGRSSHWCTSSFYERKKKKKIWDLVNPRIFALITYQDLRGVW